MVEIFSVNDLYTGIHIMEDFTIKHSPLGGNGLFAEKNFPKNTVLMRLDGIKLTRKEAFDMPGNNGDNLLQIGKDLYLDFTGKSHLFINHSCAPNSFVKVYVNTGFLMSAIPIHKDDEILIDYSLTSLETNNEWNMNCNCGVYGCRKVISGYDSLTDDKKARYKELGMIQDFILKG